MAYCTNCGTQVIDGAKFCQKCGSPIAEQSTNTEFERRSEFAGKIYKCPNCGEVLKSFTSNCPSCGFELRATKASNAVREFALKLEAIEAKREYEKPRGLFSQAAISQQVSKTDEQKISLIKNFSVPNTKEDILEFMILATSNIDTSMYGSTNTPTAGAKALSEAWNAKIKQVYAKAKNTYGNDPDFSKIQELYDSCYLEIKGQKKKKALKWVLLVGWIPLLYLILIPTLLLGNSKDNKAEETRLEAIVIEVEAALDAENYRTALMNAELMEYNGHKSDRKQYWDVRQKYYIDEILEEAQKHGVQLNYTPPVEDAQEEETNAPSGGFVQGFQEGLQPGLDATKENIDQFTDIINDIGKDITESDIEKEPQTSKVAQNFATVSIERDAVFTFGKDEFNLYVATAVTDDIIRIENWSKSVSTSKSVSCDYEVGTYKINDADNGFHWLNEEHVAFSFCLTDEHDNLFKKAKTVVFVISNSKNDTNKGSYIQDDSTTYAYGYDDWNLYKAVPINDDIIKIECWYRPMSAGSYHYSYDVCLIDIRDKTSDFEWTDSNRKAFTLTLTDSDKRGLKSGKFVVFEAE